MINEISNISISYKLSQNESINSNEIMASSYNENIINIYHINTRPLRLSRKKEEEENNENIGVMKK